MTLAPGESLGPYRIEREIGRGGMGIVHLGRDSRLDRAVAVKALPEEFAVDPERLARFEREARLLASLHHSNVAGIYGLEENAGRRFLILEYVEGVTLAERLERGALPLDEALDVCRQIALALEAAHEAGIVHRDLKPGNVKLTPAGEVKVLDFGLAKGPAGSAASSDDLSRSPTMTLAATGMGVILGTAAYMSPEQARGRPLDRRTDIWSFGAVLFECLTGVQCFAGETVSDTIARILQGEPDWTLLPASTPASVRHLLRRCLEKDARQRLRDIGDARLELEGAIAVIRSGVRPAGETPPARRSRAVWMAGAAVAGAAIGAGTLALVLSLRGAPPAPVVRFPIDLPENLRLSVSGLAEPGDWAVSPDGAWFAARVWPRGQSPTTQTGPRIYVRSMSETQWRPVPGTELVLSRPSFSLDSRFLYYAAPVSAETQDLRILRVPLTDLASSVPILDAPPEQIAGMPLPGHRALFIHADGHRFTIRAPGERGPVTWRPMKAAGFTGVMDPNPVAYAPPLTESQVFMGTTAYALDGWHRGLAVLDLRSGVLTPVLTDGQSPRLLPSGHLLFSRGQTIFAVRFDRGGLKVRGEAVPVYDGIRARGAWTPGSFQVTSRGDLYYAAGGLVGERRQLGIVELSGRVIPIGADERSYNSPPALSRDGRWIVISSTNGRGIDELWRVDLTDHSSQRLATVKDADLTAPVLSVDGTLVFARFGAAQNGIYRMPVSGDEDPVPIYLGGNSSDSVTVPIGWLAGGQRILGGVFGAVRGNLMTLDSHPADVARARFVPVLTGIPVLGGSVAWDGRWGALQSDRSGTPQIYVVPLGADGSAGKLVLASRTGNQVGWSSDDSRLYVQDSTQVKVVRIVDGAPAGPPVPLYDIGDMTERMANLTFLPDGRGVGVFRAREELELTRIEVIQNWVASIRSKLP